MADFSTTNVAATVGQGVQPMDPLKTIQGLTALQAQQAEVQNLRNQNLLFGANQAGSAAIQAGIDQTTGLYNPARANAFLAGNPQAAMATPGLLTSNLAYSTGAQTLGANRVSALRQGLGPLMTAPDVTAKDVVRQLAILKSSGAIDPDAAAALAANIPSDPIALKGFLARTVGVQALGPDGALSATTAIPTLTPVGDKLIQTQTAPRITEASLEGGAPPPVTISPGSIPLARSPDAMGQLTPVIENGVPVLKPVSAFETPQGQPKEGVPAPQAAYTPEEQAEGSAAGSAVGGQSGNYFANIHNAAVKAPDQQASLQELEGLLADPNVKTGPGSPFLSKINGLAQQFGLPVDKSWEKDTSKLDVFNKIATQIAQQQFGVIGGTGTDAKLMSAAHTSPDQMISSISNKDIIPLLRGNAAASQHIDAAANAWKAAGNGATTGPLFQQALVQNHYNPLVFQTMYMSPDEKAKIIGRLPKADQAKFQQDYEFSVNHGWVTP